MFILFLVVPRYLISYNFVNFWCFVYIRRFELFPMNFVKLVLYLNFGILVEFQQYEAVRTNVGRIGLDNPKTEGRRPVINL